MMASHVTILRILFLIALLGATAMTPAVGTADDLPPAAVGTADDLPPAVGTADHLPPAAGTADDLPPAVGTADDLPPAAGTADHLPPAEGTADDLPPAVGTADHLPPAVGTADDLPPAVGTADYLPPAVGAADDLPPAVGSPDDLPPALAVAAAAAAAADDLPAAAAAAAAADDLPAAAAAAAAAAGYPELSGCPPEEITGCTCSDGEVTVDPIEGSIETCMTGLMEGGYTTQSSLNVTEYPPLRITENILGGVLFSVVLFSTTTIIDVHPNFLGDSSNFTESIEFNRCHLPNTLPKIDSDGLLTLRYTSYNSYADLTVPKNAFSGTPSLQRLEIVPINETKIVTVPRFALRSLTNLDTLFLISSFRLHWGALHLSAASLRSIQIGRTTGSTLELAPGSISGIPRGVTMSVMGDVLGGRTPSKFFNVLRAGARIFFGGSEECGCDLAWIRYSNFVHQVDKSCPGSGDENIPLLDYDLSHCPFYQHLSMDKTEL